jgi:hypothetical protein
MSVWSDPHYRSEPLVVVTELLEIDAQDHQNVLALCDFDVGDYGDFDSPAPQGNFARNIQNGSARVRSVAYRFGRKRDPAFSDRFKLLPSPRFGIRAVYELFTAIATGELSFKPEFDQDEFKAFTSELIKAYGPSNYSSPSTWEKFADTATKSWTTTDHDSPLFWFQSAEAIRHLIVAGGIRSYKSHCKKARLNYKPLPYIESKAIFGVKAYHWKCYRHASVTILERAKTDLTPGRSYILLNKDLDRLSQMVESQGRIFSYFDTYADLPDTNELPKKMKLAAKSVLDMLLKAFSSTTAQEMNSICRSMDIGQYIYLASIAGPLSARSVNDQHRKGFDGHYDKVFPLKEFTNLLSRFRPREALELASIRKMLPVPDFCIFSAMNANKQMHYSPHEMIPHPDPDTTWDDFILYWKHSMVRNYFDRHGKCPGRIKDGVENKDWHSAYPYVVPREVPYKDIEDVDWEATFIYQDYNFAEHELRKDKTMAPNKMSSSLTSEELREMPLWDRNQIANFFLNPRMHRLTTLRTQIRNGTEDFDYIHLTAIKPEAKKEGGRMFYMANDAQRVPMSEKEANVDSYLRYKAGNSSGVSSIDLQKGMHDIASLGSPTVRKVKVSFDLEKFSPKQGRELKRAAYKMWSYAFGLPHVEKLLKVQTGSRLAFIKHNIHHEYLNPGADLEGYDAKTNTAAHIEVMAYGISRCRSLGLLQKGAKLLALIDDGGMSLEFPAEATDADIWKCINCIEGVYNMVGLRISWDKTFVSEHLFQYLNEVYYKGFKVTPGLKAFLRIGKPVDVPAKTIADDLDAVGGEVQGAIKAGAAYRTSYLAYCFEIFRILKRWSRYKVKLESRHVLCCMAPVAFGGLGVRSMLQLSTNESFNPVSSSLGNMKAFVHYYQENREVINALLNVSMRTMTADSFVRAPRAIRADTRTLNLQRFSNQMREWILKEARNPYVKAVLASTDQQSSKVLAEQVKALPQVSAVGLQAVSNVRPETAVDSLVSKLQRSQTAADLLGFKETIRIMMANRYQAQHVIEKFGKNIGVKRLDFVPVSKV